MSSAIFKCVTWLIYMLYALRINWKVSFANKAFTNRVLFAPVDSLQILPRTSYLWHDSFICVTWRIHMCDMTHSYVWHDAFICVTWRIHTCDMTHSYVWHDAFICVTWRIHMCDMTHSCVWWKNVQGDILVCDMTYSYVWHDSFICVTWLIHMCDMTHSHRNNLIGLLCASRFIGNSENSMDCWSRTEFLCVTWLIRMCDMAHWCVWHGSFVCVIWLIHMFMRFEWISRFLLQKRPLHIGFFLRKSIYRKFWELDVMACWRMSRTTFICVTWLIRTCDMTHSYATWPIHMCDMTHSYVWHDSFIRVTWLIRMCDMSHSYVWHDSFICDMTHSYVTCAW